MSVLATLIAEFMVLKVALLFQAPPLMLAVLEAVAEVNLVLLAPLALPVLPVPKVWLAPPVLPV
jgi:hypothetical protein